MKYCKTCRTFYSDEAAVCPKCGIDAARAKAEAVSSEKAEQKKVIKDWIWLVIGVPLFIGLIYLLVYILRSIN